MFRSREGTNTFRAVQRAKRSPLMRAEGFNSRDTGPTAVGSTLAGGALVRRL